MSKTFEIVKSTLIHVLKNTSILKNQRNAILEITALGDSPHKNQIIREKLMVICFSALSSWVLFLAFLFFYFNPFRYVMSITQINFLNGFVNDVLFSTDLRIILITGFTLFVISYLFSEVYSFVFNRVSSSAFQIESILLALLGFLISNGDLHLRNALLFLPMIILGRLMLQLKLLMPLKNVWPLKQISSPKANLQLQESQLLNAKTKKTWSIICALFFSAWLMTTWLTLNSFQFFSDQGVFSNSVHFLRFEFFAASTFAYYFVEFFILSVWGHFYCLKLRP